MIVSVLLGLLAAVALVTAGYLVGIRRDLLVRDMVFRDANEARGRLTVARVELGAARAELDRLLVSSSPWEASTERLRAGLDRALERLFAQRAELADAVTERKRADDRAAHAERRLAETRDELVSVRRGAARREELVAHTAGELHTAREELGRIRVVAANAQAGHVKAVGELDQLRAVLEVQAAELQRAREGEVRAMSAAQRDREEFTRIRLMAASLSDDLRRSQEFERRMRELASRREEELNHSREREQEHYGELTRLRASFSSVTEELARRREEGAKIDVLSAHVREITHRMSNPAASREAPPDEPVAVIRMASRAPRRTLSIAPAQNDQAIG